ncbi:hypothetical protein HF563_02075 [Acidithiobacillus ferridurans]|nr:hypothetical protein [Acidithiobacillus ferridurans]
MKNGNSNTPRDQALAAVPEQRLADLLARAADLGVQSPQDAVWILLAMTLDAKEQVDSVARQVERLCAEMAQWRTAAQQQSQALQAAMSRVAAAAEKAGSEASAAISKALDDAMSRETAKLVKGIGDAKVNAVNGIALAMQPAKDLGDDMDLLKRIYQTTARSLDAIEAGARQREASTELLSLWFAKNVKDGHIGYVLLTVLLVGAGVTAFVLWGLGLLVF